MKDLESLVDKFVHNTITDQELTLLMGFIRKPENESHFKSLMDGYRNVEGQQPVGAPDIAKAKAAMPPIRREQTKRIGLASIWIKVAAIMLFVLGLGWLGYHHRAMLSDAMVTYCEVRTEARQTAKIRLPDGSRVILNQRSTLHYPERFGNWHVDLQGEAFFNVARDEQRPFRIVMPEGEIEVLGTTFNVKQNADSSLVVAVSEGKVALRFGKQEVILRHGDLGVVANQHIRVQQVNNIANYASWFNHQLVFKETKLVDIVLQLEDLFDVIISIPSNSVKNTHLSFQMKKAPVNKVLHEIALTLNLSLSQQGNHYTLTE